MYLGGNPRWVPLKHMRLRIHQVHTWWYMKRIPMKQQPTKYKETTTSVIDSFFQCRFDKIDKTILSALSRYMFREKSKALSKRQLPQFTSQRLSNACKSYDHTVIKILSARVPNTTILTLEKLFQEQNQYLSLIHIWRCRRSTLCRSRWSPYH